MEVKDESGAVVPGTEVALAQGGRPTGWKKLDAVMEWQSSVQEEYLQHSELFLAVRAAGFATTHHSLPGKYEHHVSLTLKKPSKVEINLKTPRRPIPADLKPIVVTSFDFMDASTLMNEWLKQKNKWYVAPELRSIESVGPGRFEFLHHPDEEFFVLVHHKGFLRAFTAGPFQAKSLNGHVEITLPNPGILSVDFDPQDTTQLREVTLDLDLLGKNSKGQPMGYRTPINYEVRKEGALSLEWADLAPGQYRVRAGTFDMKSEHDVVSYDTREVDVKDRPLKVSLNSKSKLSRLKGDYAATVQLKRFDGKPAANIPYELVSQGEALSETKITEGKSSTSGVIQLKDLAGGPGSRTLTLRAGNERFDLQLSGVEQTRQISFELPPTIGDSAPDIEFADLYTGERKHLSDFRGKVVYLDFWAVDCPPCQKPMEENNALVSLRAKDWQGKAEIIPLSIDESPDELKKHIEKKQWKALRHFWSFDKKGFNSATAKTYRVRGIPTSLLIDPDGKIVWRGHPIQIEPEKEITKLLMQSAAQ